ncbi:uncharacterized protein EDB91DRAFT_126680 [Suillus paluster]|uniref:uncharacterized protein n=1 Tax=Suillus paluster TaxID=48578 RepID=UPI001B8839BC|nr:uncharacterized protein EDB91DRAFT_126680 [Suillus paluster]KAG1745848.1 hypothetical protein EDB91DRAFT_126680 [Suillus paluster]
MLTLQNHPSSRPRFQVTIHFPAPSQSIMTIYNTVLYKFKSEATLEQREYVKALIKELPSRISALQSVITGEKILNSLDHGYDMGVIFLFESKHKLDEFRPHQAHTDYRALSAPYLEDKLIFDMETA